MLIVRLGLRPIPLTTCMPASTCGRMVMRGTMGGGSVDGCTSGERRMRRVASARPTSRSSSQGTHGIHRAIDHNGSTGGAAGGTACGGNVGTCAGGVGACPIGSAGTGGVGCAIAGGTGAGFGTAGAAAGGGVVAVGCGGRAGGGCCASGGCGGRAGAAGSQIASLPQLQNELMTLYNIIEDSDAAPTSQVLAAARSRLAQSRTALAAVRRLATVTNTR